MRVSIVDWSGQEISLLTTDAQDWAAAISSVVAERIVADLFRAGLLREHVSVRVEEDYELEMAS